MKACYFVKYFEYPVGNIFRRTVSFKYVNILLPEEDQRVIISQWNGIKIDRKRYTWEIHSIHS